MLARTEGDGECKIGLESPALGRGRDRTVTYRDHAIQGSASKVQHQLLTTGIHIGTFERANVYTQRIAACY